MIWNVLTILVALVGGVGAVMVGQVLTLYREDIDAARRTRYQIAYIQLATEKSGKKLSVSEIERISRKMKENLEDVSRENMWLFSRDGEIYLLELMFNLSRLEYAASDGDADLVDDYVDNVKNKCDSMDGEIAYVTLTGATRRFFGTERPYDDFREVRSQEDEPI